MRLKSFFADTIEEAIQIAHREMGPEAMLVNSKRTGPEARHLGGYEVVCAVETGIPAPPPSSQFAGANPSFSVLPTDKLSREVSEIRQQMERLAMALTRSGSGLAGIAADAELSKVFAILAEAEIDADLAYEIVAQIRSSEVSQSLRTVLSRLISTAPALGTSGSLPRVVALVGPPGSGKTTTLVKLAARYGVTSRKPAQILSVDTYRIGAAEQLSSYASILGVGFQLLETTAALAQALDEHSQKELILIDTPGLAATELDGFLDLARFLSSYPRMDTHLVLPASMRTSDLKRTAQQYQFFEPAKLLFTRLDETDTFGPIVNQTVRMKKPISFLSQGQRIPEDLEPASQELIVDLVLKSRLDGRPKFGTVAA